MRMPKGIRDHRVSTGKCLWRGRSSERESASLDRRGGAAHPGKLTPRGGKDFGGKTRRASSITLDRKVITLSFDNRRGKTPILPRVYSGPIFRLKCCQRRGAVRVYPKAKEFLPPRTLGLADAGDRRPQHFLPLRLSISHSSLSIEDAERAAQE